MNNLTRLESDLQKCWEKSLKDFLLFQCAQKSAFVRLGFTKGIGLFNIFLHFKDILAL